MGAEHAATDEFSIGAAVTCAAAACLAWSCVAPPTPPPPLRVETDAFLGTVLTGPLPGSSFDEGAWADAWLVEARITYLTEDLLPTGGEPVSAFTRLVVAEPEGDPLLTRSELALDVRRLGAVDLAGAGAGARLWEDRRWASLALGTTTVLSAERDSPARQGPNEWQSFAIELSRPRNAREPLACALVLEGWVAPRVDAEGIADAEDEGREPTRPDPVQRRERLLLTSAAAGEDGVYRFLFPAPAGRLRPAAFVVEVGAAPSAETPDLAAIVERTRVDLTRAIVRAREASHQLTSAAGRSVENSAFVRALAEPVFCVPALVLLAGRTEARLTEHIALDAAPETIMGLVDRLRADSSSIEAAGSEQELGWLLESNTYLWLAARAGDGGEDLEPPLRAALLRHTGELGRYPDLVADAVRECRNGIEFTERLARENATFLEDSHPAARVRAYDWLSVRELAPADFDPLESREERRAALAAHESALASDDVLEAGQ